MAWQPADFIHPTWGPVRAGYHPRPVKADWLSRHHVDPGWLAGVRMACGRLLLLAPADPGGP